MPRYYPLYLNIEGQICLVVGGGPVAERKVSGLLDARARVRIVSPTLTPQLQSWAEQSLIETIALPYTTSFLQDIVLVFAATNNREVNAQIAQDARAKGLWVTVADAPEEGSFVSPSVLRRGELCLSISTGGANPMLAARLSEELAQRFGPEYGEFVELLGQMRAYIKTRVSHVGGRRVLLARLLEPDTEAEIRTLLREGQAEKAREQALYIINAECSPE